MPVSKKAFHRYKILNELLKSRNGYTIKQLTERVNDEMAMMNDGGGEQTVTDRMIRVDLTNMEELYLVQIGKKGTRYCYENSNESIDNVNLKEEDKTAINLALGVFSRFNGTPLYDKFSDAITRIIANSVVRKINTTDTRKIVQVAEVSTKSGIEWLETIYNAIVDKKALLLEYKSFGEKTSSRVISPYMIKEFRNKWYMIAYVHHSSKDEKTLVHKLSRIQDIKETDEVYHEDRSFNGDKYFRYTLGVFHKHSEEPIDVKLKLRGKAVIRLFSEDKIHDTQELIPTSEEEATMEMRVYNSPELETFILGYGEAIEVIEPQALRESIINKLNKSIAHY